jgi:hypothetical protein
MEGSEKLDFYPTLVSPNKGKLTITLPWGSQHDLSGNHSSITVKSATNPLYDEVANVIYSYMLTYSSDKVRKGFVLPDGAVYFILDEKEYDAVKRPYATIMSNTHQNAKEQIVNSCDDYMAAIAYLNDSVEITNTAFVYDKRTNSMEEHYNWTEGNGYTVKIKGTLNYAQREGLLKFIEQARNDGYRVMLITLDGKVHVSTEDITKYDTAEDLYKLFLKKYNATPQETQVELGFSGEQYEEFLKFLQKMSEEHPLTYVHFTDDGLSTGDDFKQLSRMGVEKDYIITTDGKIWPLPTYKNADGFYRSYSIMNAESFYTDLNAKIDSKLVKLFLDNSFKISYSKFGEVFRLYENEYGATDAQIKTVNKIMYAFKRYISDKHYAKYGDDGYYKHIAINDFTGQIYSYYKDDTSEYEYSRNDISMSPYLSIVSKSVDGNIFRKDRTLDDAGFQEHQIDVLDSVDTEQIAKFSKREYTETDFKLKEDLESGYISVMEYEDELEDEITLDWGDLGGMGFAKTNSTKKEITKINKEKSAELKTKNKAKYADEEKQHRSRSKLTHEKAKGNNLMYFVKKYKQLALPDDLADFIKATTDKRGLDEWIMERIKGKFAGTLSMSDVMYRISTVDKMDERTYKLLNKYIFKNPYIKTFEELNKLVSDESEKYYAVRALLSQTSWGKNLLERDTKIDSEQFEQIVEMLQRDNTVTETGLTVADAYDKIITRYHSYKKSDLVVDKGYLRRLWLKYYDGTLDSGGRAASLAKWAAALNWKISHSDAVNKATSLSKMTAEDLELGDLINDEDAEEGFNAINEEIDNNSKVNLLMEMLELKILKKIRKNVSNIADYSSQVKNELTNYREKYEKLSDKALLEKVRQIEYLERQEVERYIEKYGKREGLARLTAEEEMLREELSMVLNYIESSVSPAQGYTSRIRSHLRTIKSKIPDSDIKRLLKDNSDILTDNLTLKRDAYLKNPNEKSTRKLQYKSTEVLDALEKRILKIKENVKLGVYKSSKMLDLKEQYDKTVAKLDKAKADALISKKGETKTYEVKNYVINFTGDSVEMPASLKRLFDTTFTKFLKTKTKDLEGIDEYHLRMNMTEFIEQHATDLEALTQEDVDQIVEFYLNSSLSKSTGEGISRMYNAVEIYLLTYLLRGNAAGQFVLNEEQSNVVNEHILRRVQAAATDLAVWKKAKQYLDPEKALIQGLMKSNDLQFSEKSIENLVKATKELQSIKDVNSNDYKIATRNVVKAKQAMYEEGVKTFKGRKQSVWNKLLKFEQTAMLSSPGTWLRNLASNYIVSGTNKVIDKLITKLPSKKGLSVEQYKIAGTKISDNVKKFIDDTFKTKFGDSNYTLLDLLGDSFNKYDVRKIKNDDSLDILTKQITNAIRSDIFGSVHSTNLGRKELTNWEDKISSFVFKMLSDKKFIDSAALTYFGKILTETNADLSQGLADKKILEYFSQAFVLASHEYMHKTNIFNSLDEMMRNTSAPVYFLYKQFMPFAATGWNWFVESLKFTPLGLAQSIVQYAKLENTISKIEDQLQSGKQVPDSRFAEYIVKRNITKGIIGTIGTVIGSLLFAFGYARIDEEDDKYKLYVADNVAIDISDVFGTQGIFMGITLGDVFQKIFAKDTSWKDVERAFVATLDYLLMDSTFNDLFNLFRYNDSVGDWVSYAPFKVLNMFIPNLLKTVSDVAMVYDVKFDDGVLGKIEKMATNIIPFLAYAFPKQYDPYTGELQTMYHAQFVTEAINKTSPLKIYPYKVTDTEKEALSVGVKKISLTGRYEIDGTKITINAKDNSELNEFYGKLNKDELDILMNNKTKYRVWNDAKNKYEELTYSKMTQKQKASVINRIMDNNAGYAKIYILNKNGYKYYASESEYKTLKSLGINCYKATDKKKGFVKI